MKTSQKEGVSDRPPNARDLPRCEAPQLNRGRLTSVQRELTPYQAVRILALLPLRSPAPDVAHYVIGLTVDVDMSVTNGFLSHRPSSPRSGNDLDVLRNRCASEDVRRTHPRRPVPRPQVVGRLRLRPPTLAETRHDQPPGTLDFVTAKDNVVLLGPLGTGKTHLCIDLGIRACQAGHRVAFATAAQWVARLADAHHTGRLEDELVKLDRIALMIVDEIGYIRLVYWWSGTGGLEPLPCLGCRWPGSGYICRRKTGSGRACRGHRHPPRCGSIQRHANRLEVGLPTAAPHHRRYERGAA